MERKNTLSPARRAYEVTMRSLLYLSAFATCALLLLIIGYICVKGVPGISWQFLTTEESVLNDTVGILPAIYNTLFVIFVSLVIVLPLGVGAAIYLTEYAKSRRLVTAIEYATETLAGIPSIVFGFFFLGLGCFLLARNEGRNGRFRRLHFFHFHGDKDSAR